jgi:hypothetical protein
MVTMGEAMADIAASSCMSRLSTTMSMMLALGGDA